MVAAAVFLVVRVTVFAEQNLPVERRRVVGTQAIPAFMGQEVER
jgi:hypothetical protein